MNITLALEYGWPGKFWSLKDNDYNQLLWNDSANGMPKPTLAEIQTAYDNYIAAQSTAAANDSSALANAKQAINSLSGRTVSSLTNSELLTLFKAVAFKAGAIDVSDPNNFKVADPSKWLFKG